jgi:pimeloyl-ACP methyl ester carboxylesterase
MPKVKSNDVEIQYELRGEGTPLVMIMGWGSSSERWHPTLTEELAKHHRLILIDNRGTGQSDKPDNEYSIEMMAHDVASIMDAISVSEAHVFGVSMGGMIAQEFALHYPEKVKKLILGCTFSGGSHGIYSEEVRKLVKEFASDDPPEMTPELGNKMLSLSLTPSFIKENHDTIMKTLMSIKYPTPAFTMSRQAQAILKHDTYDRLTQIKAPTLILIGDKDSMIPIENSSILAEMIPNAQIKMFEGVGHNFTAGIEKKVAKTILTFLT